MKEESLKIEKICRDFETDSGTQRGFNNIDLTIYKGNFTVIMGSSGSENPLCSYSLSGMDTITSGHIRLSDTDLSSLSGDEMAIFRREFCGFVFQQICLINSMSILDNVLAAELLRKCNELWQTLENLYRQLQKEKPSVRLLDDWSPESIRQFISACFSETNTEQSLLAQRTADYIAEHFAEPITQSDVAQVLGVTPAYLSSVFHEAKGESYTKFLTRVRMTQAALLLRSNPLLTVQTIAEMTGYVSDKHFISVFKKFFQVTPSEYRRRQKQ